MPFCFTELTSSYTDKEEPFDIHITAWPMCVQKVLEHYSLYLFDKLLLYHYNVIILGRHPKLGMGSLTYKFYKHLCT